MADSLAARPSEALAGRLLGAFVAAGAAPVTADILQPADVLLDLYGEDIRARAYVTADPLRGELMLRPDFTVPVVRAHIDAGAGAARYAYAGPVFRRQQPGSRRPSEFLQVGYEVLGAPDPAAAEAEVFALFAQVLRPYGLKAATGDMGVLAAAVEGLETSAARKAALMRHLWRPRRFRRLLERFAQPPGANPARAALAEALSARGASALIVEAGPLIGLRGEEEIAARLESLAEDARQPALPAAQVAAVEAVLALAGPSGAALEGLGRLAADLPALGPAAERLGLRLAALEALGVDAGALPFEASFGRTTLEYYDGFVFGFQEAGAAHLPAIASGGRYDALTRVLGAGADLPAMGGVIRPDLLAAHAEAVA